MISNNNNNNNNNNSNNNNNNILINNNNKQDITPLCRMCGERDETVSHVVAECKKLVQPQYKAWRHDRLAVEVHRNMCKRYKLPYKAQWYEYTPESTGK